MPVANGNVVLSARAEGGLCESVIVLDITKEAGSAPRHAGDIEAFVFDGQLVGA